MEESKSRFVWVDATGDGRNQYCLFRKSFTLLQAPVQAEICLFADNAYQLFLNGQLLGYGPARFDPRYPLYDKHDITAALQTGHNTISVVVNHFGTPTFRSVYTESGGFIAWGYVTDGTTTISLDTHAGAWKCVRQTARSRYAPHMSFALSMMDLYEATDESAKMLTADYDDTDWDDCVELLNQQAYGPLAPRNIPFMDQSPIQSVSVCGVQPLGKREIVSFEIPMPHYYESFHTDAPAPIHNALYFYTWVYAPKRKKCAVTISAGRFWLNGQELLLPPDRARNGIARPVVLSLEEGWNHFFGVVRCMNLDIVYFMLGYDPAYALRISADRQCGSDKLFCVTKPLSPEAFAKAFPQDESFYAQESYAQGGCVQDSSARDGDCQDDAIWEWIGAQHAAQSPVYRQVFDHLLPAVEEVSFDELPKKVFSLDDYPQGFRLLLALDYTRLAFPTLSFAGVKGATIDLVYSEHLSANREKLLQADHVLLGDRILCQTDTVDWLPHTPRGMYYVSVTVRNMQTDCRIDKLAFLNASYPAKPVGSFHCSDELLNRVWALGVPTLLSNMEDVYTDCPTRERGLYVRDMVIAYAVNEAVLGDHALMHRCLQLYGQSNVPSGMTRCIYPVSAHYPIADFSLNLLEGYRMYVENTGDAKRIQEDWESITQSLAFFQMISKRRDDGLMDADWHTKIKLPHLAGRGFRGDFSTAEGYIDSIDINCAFSAQFICALKSAAFLADVIRRPDEADAFTREAEKIACSVNDVFWDEQRGCYADNEAHTTFSVQANAMAVLAGIVPRDKLESLKRHMTRDLRNNLVNGVNADDNVYVSASHSIYVLQALYALGLARTAEDFMRQSFGFMLSHNPTTMPEYFQKDMSLHRSMCHIWSCAPTHLLSRHVLGIHTSRLAAWENTAGDEPHLSPASRPTLSPDEILIRVTADGIDYAEGVYPHPRGIIEIKWHREGSKRIFDYIRVPEGVRIILEEPDCVTL